MIFRLGASNECSVHQLVRWSNEWWSEVPAWTALAVNVCLKLWLARHYLILFVFAPQLAAVASEGGVKIKNYYCYYFLCSGLLALLLMLINAVIVLLRINVSVQEKLMFIVWKIFDCKVLIMYVCMCDCVSLLLYYVSCLSLEIMWVFQLRI